MLNDTFFQIEDYLVYCKTKGLAIKTIKSYEQTLRLFEAYCISRNIHTFSKVTKKIIMEYIFYLQERGKYTVIGSNSSSTTNHPDKRSDLGKKISASTINSYLRNIKAFFTYCVEFDLMKTNPAISIKQLPTKRKAKDFITDEQFKRLLNGFQFTSYSEYRDYTITNLLMDTGMRISECLMIQIKDIDFQKRTIYLFAENTKGKKDRAVFFSPQMLLILKRWMKFRDVYTDTSYLFSTQKGTPIINGIFEKNFRKYCSRIHLENVSPHTLRNNFAKRFLMNGGNIYTLSQILGHSSVVVTETAYLDLTDDDIRVGYEQFSPLSRMR